MTEPPQVFRSDAAIVKRGGNQRRVTPCIRESRQIFGPPNTPAGKERCVRRRSSDSLDRQEVGPCRASDSRQIEDDQRSHASGFGEHGQGGRINRPGQAWRQRHTILKVEAERYAFTADFATDRRHGVERVERFKSHDNPCAAKRDRPACADDRRYPSVQPESRDARQVGKDPSMRGVRGRRLAAGSLRHVDRIKVRHIELREAETIDIRACEGDRLSLDRASRRCLDGTVTCPHPVSRVHRNSVGEIEDPYDLHGNAALKIRDSGFAL